MSAPGGPPESSIEMLFTEVGPYLIAVEARQVRTIRDGAGSVDLAQKLNRTAAFSGAWPRRVLEITTSRGTVDLVAGEEVWPGVVAATRLQALPGLLAGAFRDAGIGRLFLEEEHRFAFVLDPEALL
jgi:hypothetical protein